MVVGDYGVTYVIPLSFDAVQGNVTPSVSLTLVSPGGIRTSVSMSVGGETITGPQGSYLAGFWVYRIQLATDFSVPGIHQAQLQLSYASSPPAKVSSRPFSISIDPLE